METQLQNQVTGLNFRDLGGLPTRIGGQLRHGILFRSEGPKNFAPAQREVLRAIGFRAIFDLRSEGERSETPHDWQGTDCVWLHCDMNNDLRAADKTEWDRLRDSDDATVGIAVMSQNYAAMPAALMAHWLPMANALLSGATPAMINCTAGKDRTGVAVALLLDLAGVPREAILVDYQKSAVFGRNMEIAGSLERGFMESFGFVPGRPIIDALVGVKAEFLEAAMNETVARWGGIQAYFEASGLDGATQDRLRVLLA
jgi:protein-tyrosine phosphatase